MLAPASRTVFCYSSTVAFRKMFSEAVACSLLAIAGTGIGGRGLKSHKLKSSCTWISETRAVGYGGRLEPVGTS